MDSELVMIDDERVTAVVIEDCGEPLVDAEPVMQVATDHPRATSRAETRYWCRESVLELLRRAGEALPKDIYLVLAEAHRPLALQRSHWEADLQKVRDANPKLSAEEVIAETAKYVAPPWMVSPHSTGGAVDVILFERATELPMGCELNEQCPAMRTDFEDLTSSEQRNRRLLSEAMTSVGFVNYGQEWWHYSYGDQYWAQSTGADAAIYGSI